MLNENERGLLDMPSFTTLVTLLPDGQPHGAVMWHRRAGEQLSMVAAEQSRKVRNLRRDPRATVVVLDPNDAYRYVEMRCTVSIAAGDAAARAELAAIGARYVALDEAQEYARTVGGDFVRLTLTLNRVISRLPS